MAFLFLLLFKTLVVNKIDLISGVKMWLQLSKSKFSKFFHNDAALKTYCL